MRTRVVFAIVLVFLVVGSWGLIRLTKPIATGDNAQFTVIGTMQSRDKIVTIKTGTEGIVYSIATKNGQSLYENISAERLKAQAPALHEFIERGTAGYAGLYELRIDASR